MDRWKGKTAFVSGASAGIGYDLSKRLCELGMNVIGCARNIEKIEDLSQKLSETNGKTFGRLVAVKCDVSIEEEVKAVFERAKVEFGGVDVCINNAGLAHNAPLLSGATSDWKNMLDVNILGLCICTREFMAQLKERSVNTGHIILLNSMSGHRLVTSSTRKMKKSTLQLNRMYERRKRTLLDEEKCLRKKNRYFKFHLEIARNVTMQIVEQLKNGRDLIQDTLLAKKTEKEEGMKILRQTLEAEIQEADENAAKLSDETRNVDDKIKAVNTKTKFIQLALEDLERQMQLNILSMHNEIDECKAKLAQTAEPIKPPSNAKSTSVMASLRKRFNHITCRSTISYKVDDKVNNDANGNSEGLPDSCTSRLEDKKNI